MQEKQFRNQVTWTVFIFSILVIWVHSYNTELFAGEWWGPIWERASEIEKFVSVGLGQIAVPGFFMMSSYLFFRNFKMKKLFEKWKSRFFSVFVPYVAWTALYYLGYMAATRIPIIVHVVGREPVPFNIEEMLYAVCKYSYAPIFWYLYQLLFLILLSPVIYMVIRNKRIGMAYMAVLLAALYLHLDLTHPNTDALFYYSAAAYMAVHGRTLAESRGTWKRLVPLMVMIGLIGLCYNRMQQAEANVLWIIFYRCLVPVSIWMLLSFLHLPKARPWMRQSMFLYAVHFIMVRFVNKGTALLLHKIVSEFMCAVMSLLVFFALPFLIVPVSYFIARLLVHFCPLIWRILSGGRKLD